MKRKKPGGARASSDSDEQNDNVQKEKENKIEKISHVSSSVTASTTTEDPQPQKLFHNRHISAYSFDDNIGSLSRPGSSTVLNSNPDLITDDSNENDIGRYIGRASLLSTEKKKNCWKAVGSLLQRMTLQKTPNI